MTQPRSVYPTLEDYYAADIRRRKGEECDYGAHWRLDNWTYRWRVSYVRDTGEIYAVHRGNTLGPVFAIGIIPPDPVHDGGRSLWYSTLDSILEGWAKQCTRPNSLRWIKDHLDNAGLNVPPR